MTTNWVILRTSGRSTLPLAASLAGDGFRVWTPAGFPEDMNRRPRSRSRRPRLSDDDMVPIIPTFIFAGEDHLDDLAVMSRLGRFSVMCDKIRQRGFVVIADRSLDHLRTVEARAIRKRPRAPVPAFGEGEAIRVPSGPYMGMSGIVESSDGKKTWLYFGGIMGRVQIETFILRPDAEDKLAA